MSVKDGWPVPIDLAAHGAAPRAEPGRSFSPIDPGGPSRRRRVSTPRADGDHESIDGAIGRGTDALLEAGAHLDLRDPMLPSVLGFMGRHGLDVLPSPVLGAWRSKSLTGPPSGRGSPWELGYDALPNSSVYDPPDRVGALWRPREQDWLDRDPTGFGHRLLAPIALAENVDFLASMSEDRNAAVARTASEILSEIQPRMEEELAGSVGGDDPWRDTFALWLLTRRPAALARLHPLVFAIATRYGTLASRLAGLVCGTRYPFEAVPLVSANAHLGLALWRLDYRATLLPGIVSFIRSRQEPAGGFADEGQPADVLTTLAAAELLSTLDPGFDPLPAARWLASVQEPEGWWRALDPEAPWLTAAVVEWLEDVKRPFAERFRWPAYQRVDLDRKTGIPGFAAFDRIARVFETIPGFAASPISLAFCDLAGFREFNTEYGQDMGDRMLRTFATTLAELDASLAVRDGGDEFIVVGAPRRRDLAADLERMLAGWPDRLRHEYGAAVRPVAPRVLMTSVEGRDLREGREELGRGIARLKAEVPNPHDTGVLRHLSD